MAIRVTASLLSSLLYAEIPENVMENNGFPKSLSLLFHTWTDLLLKTLLKGTKITHELSDLAVTGGLMSCQGVMTGRH